MAHNKAVFPFVRSFLHFLFLARTPLRARKMNLLRELPSGSSCHYEHSGLPSPLSLLIIGSKKITVVAA